MLLSPDQAGRIPIQPPSFIPVRNTLSSYECVCILAAEGVFADSVKETAQKA